MLCKNISKNLFFVTVFFAFACVLTNCKFVSSHGFGFSDKNKDKSAADFSVNYEKPKVLGAIKSDEITESSGIVESRCNKNVLWTHNDSGDGNYIYALNLQGQKLGTFRVTGAKNSDWEDIATFKTQTGECFLYIGDIGNNELEGRQQIIYRVREPTVTGDTNTNRSTAIDTEQSETIKFLYPDTPHNAETLMIHPTTGEIYILTKESGNPAGVYKLAANYNLDSTNQLQKISDFTVPAVPYGLLTGGEISPDGKRTVVCDYFAGYEIELPQNAKSFDDIWKQKPVKIDLGERKQGEAVGYSADGKSIYATSEKKNSPLIVVTKINILRSSTNTDSE